MRGTVVYRCWLRAPGRRGSQFADSLPLDRCRQADIDAFVALCDAAAANRGLELKLKQVGVQ